jgi:hypothetical protein
LPTAVRPSTQQFGAPMLKSEQIYDLKDEVRRAARKAEGVTAQTEPQNPSQELHLPILPDSQRTCSDNPCLSFNNLFIEKEAERLEKIWKRRRQKRDRKKQQRREKKEAKSAKKTTKRELKQVVKERLKKDKLQKKEQ